METLLPLADRIAKILMARRETVGVAESSSGGLISAALLAVPGALAYYIGGGVIYTARARHRLLDITEADVEGMRSASEPYALLLARTAAARLSATWGLSETGAAGPSGNPYGDAAGHTCVALSGPIERVRTVETGSADRAANMRAFSHEALRLFIEALEQDGS